ncbi:MAG: tetratricopeptide repeat protein [Mariniphaga sp.]
MIDIERYINEAKAALENGQTEDAIGILDQLIIENYQEAMFMKGEIYYKLQQWGKALNEFSRYRDFFPDDKRTDSYILMIRNILGFYYRDLYNP